MARVKLENVGVSLYQTTKISRANAAPSANARIIYHNRMTEILALKNISFEAKEGDRIGLIGKNGSGKTTLIKLLAGNLTETSGKLSIEGRIMSQISIGSGIKADLSARENAYLKCLYFGVEKALIQSKLDDIERISDLGDFFNLPVGTYSSGMKARFVMSLLSIVTADILVMDEWIGTIDHKNTSQGSALQEQVLAKPSIVFLASHSEKLIKSITNKCLWLDTGNAVRFGPTEQVLQAYINTL